MKKIALIILCCSVLSCQKNNTKNTMKSDLSNNPFRVESTLPYHAPDFTKIKNKDFKPALLEGMRQQAEAVNAIANSQEKPTFDNTILALEKSGRLLGRVNSVFNSLAGADSNDSIKAIETFIAPKLSQHYDEIYLNDKLFKRVKAIYDTRKTLNLDAESLKLVEIGYQDFTAAGANLSDQDKTKLKSINGQLATLSTQFNQDLLAAAKESAIEIHDVKKLDGFSKAQLENIKDKSKANTWHLTITNTTQQWQLQHLKNRAVRKQLFEAGWSRTDGGKYDTQPIVIKMVSLRAQKAQLLGFDNYASWRLQNTMAKKPQAVLDLFSKLVPAATAKARKEASDIQKMIYKDGKSLS